MNDGHHGHTHVAGDIEFRRAAPADEPQVRELLRTVMGWESDGHDEDFFTWKHRANPFGESPAWVAVEGDDVVGYRTFLRWEFSTAGDRTVRAVRAVDTVTSPTHRGQGIFRRLTLTAVADLTLSGEGIVFNTPNDQSRPGYLSMGWSLVGRVPVGVVPRSIGSATTMATARTPAALWSEPTAVGLEARDAMQDPAIVDGLLRHAPRRGFRTHRTAAYLAWRTAFEPLHYRLLLADEQEAAAGGIIFRLRRRGAALEAAVIEHLVPNARTGAALVRRMLQESGADYAIGTRSTRPIGLLPLPGQGPLLTARPLATSPPGRQEWALSLGDVELF